MVQTEIPEAVFPCMQKLHPRGEARTQQTEREGLCLQEKGVGEALAILLWSV